MRWRKHIGDRMKSITEMGQAGRYSPSQQWEAPVHLCLSVRRRIHFVDLS
jgi:hypothetical protein